MSRGARTPRIGTPTSLCILLAGVLFLLDCTVECQPARTAVVHDSEELASALRNASSASQTTPTDTVIYLDMHSSEVSNIPCVDCHTCSALSKVSEVSKPAVVQAAQNAGFFVIDRQDFLTNTTINIWPGQKVTIASGMDHPAPIRVPISVTSKGYNPMSFAHGQGQCPMAREHWILLEWQVS